MIKISGSTESTTRLKNGKVLGDSDGGGNCDYDSGHNDEHSSRGLRQAH